MSQPPIQVQYSGEGIFMALRSSVKVCQDNFGQGEIVTMAVVEERSKKSHDHFFVTMEEMWATRPEHLEQMYPTADSFRKRALITTGHCDTNTVLCASRAEARRIVALVNLLAPESVAAIHGTTVTVFTAHSQSMRAMGKAAFQKSKDDCLAWAANQLGIDSSQGAGGANNPARVAA